MEIRQDLALLSENAKRSAKLFLCGAPDEVRGEECEEREELGGGSTEVSESS